jgi:hypothetical protein
MTCEGKVQKLNSNVNSTKTLDYIEPHKTFYILLQTSLDPSTLYSSNANALLWEENISMSFISENSLCCNGPQHVQNHKYLHSILTM